MKPTVDLTQDRMFPEPDRRKLPDWMTEDSLYDQLNKIFTRQINRLPWELEISLKRITSDNDLMPHQEPLIITGSAAYYRRMDDINRSASNEYCDRCGKKIVTPWRWDSSLCEECSRLLDRECNAHKIPWEDGPNFWNPII